MCATSAVPHLPSDERTALTLFLTPSRVNNVDVDTFTPPAPDLGPTESPVPLEES